ncbi:hypothetical protein OG978_43725 (plasmid) [Streptomyces sp. NBC_01591]|uniref:hypothetical protein n=1 Tax=Streptomyces sp. NBC_01591 TaxID=2975888 RepID=UPI002DD7BB54|nr:hypothetical protein [Streptomyces sp. NBC_01591]WSD74635.1 hypothetical protein OG978_43725 [Streptomyces sp. NBC_01591]
MMRLPAARGPALAGFRAVLGLLVAVVALLCVSSQAEQADHSAAPTPAGFSADVEQLQFQERVSLVVEGDVSAPPCGKKMVLERRAPRVDSHSFVTVSSCLSAQDLAFMPGSEFDFRASPAGPAPPRPSALHSVLRI